MANTKKPVIDYDVCMACGICSADCPLSCIALRKKILIPTRMPTRFWMTTIYATAVPAAKKPARCRLFEWYKRT